MVAALARREGTDIQHRLPAAIAGQRDIGRRTEVIVHHQFQRLGGLVGQRAMQHQPGRQWCGRIRCIAHRHRQRHQIATDGTGRQQGGRRVRRQSQRQQPLLTDRDTLQRHAGCAQHLQLGAFRQPRIDLVQQCVAGGGIEHHDRGLPFVVTGIRQTTGSAGIAGQHLDVAAGQHRMAGTHMRYVGDELVQFALGIEMVLTTGAVTGGKHRGTPFGEALLGAVVDHRYARDRHQRHQRLLEALLVAQAQVTVGIVAVEEVRRQLRITQDTAVVGGLQTVGQIAGCTTAGKHIQQRTLQREVQQRIGFRLVGRALIGGQHLLVAIVQLAEIGLPYLTKGVEMVTAGLFGGSIDTVGAVNEIVEEIVLDVLDGIHAEGIDADLADPVTVSLLQCATHRRAAGVDIVQIGELIGLLLDRILEVIQVRRPVEAVCGRILARVIVAERCHRRCRHRMGLVGMGDITGAGVLRIQLAGVIAEEVTHVVGDDILDQEHAAGVQAIGELLVSFQITHVLVDLGKVGCPITVVTGDATFDIAFPLVGDRRRQPDRGHAQPLDIIQFIGHALDVATGVVLQLARIVLGGTLIVVARIAIVKAVRQHEIDHLITPVR